MKNSKNGDKTYYLPICMSIGLSIGVAIGAGFDSIPMGMCFGMAIGVCVGSALDGQNRKKESGETQEETPDL